MEEISLFPRGVVEPIEIGKGYCDYYLDSILPYCSGINARFVRAGKECLWVMDVGIFEHSEIFNFKVVTFWPTNTAARNSPIDNLCEYERMVLRYPVVNGALQIPGWVRVSRADFWYEDSGRELADTERNIVITHKRFI